MEHQGGEGKPPLFRKFLNPFGGRLGDRTRDLWFRRPTHTIYRNFQDVPEMALHKALTAISLSLTLPQNTLKFALNVGDSAGDENGYKSRLHKGHEN